MMPEFHVTPQTRRLAFDVKGASYAREDYIDRITIQQYGELISHGVSPIFIIAHDEKLLRIVGDATLEYGLETVIPIIEESLRRGDEQSIFALIDEIPLHRAEIPFERRRTVKELIEWSGLMKNESYESVGNKYDVTFQQEAGDSQLSVADMPGDLYCIKMFDPNLIIESRSSKEKFDTLQSKLLHVPFVTSVYANEHSMSYYGVGVRVTPSRIIRAYITDIASGQTTKTYSPDPLKFDHYLQFADWNGVRVFCDVRAACMLNERSVWYPEFFIEPDQIESVVVRPYDAYVTYSGLMGRGFKDGNRAVAARLLAESLGGLPIEILP